MRYIFGGDFHSSLHILLFTKTHTFYFRRCKLIFFVITQRGVNTTIFFQISGDQKHTRRTQFYIKKQDLIDFIGLYFYTIQKQNAQDRVRPCFLALFNFRHIIQILPD